MIAIPAGTRLALSPHFDLAEFASKDGSDTPLEVVPRLTALCVQVLEPLRDYLDGRPIIVTSGWRSAAHNKAVGGAAKSRHRLGDAADLTLLGDGGSPDLEALHDAYAWLAMSQRAGSIPAGGLHLYQHHRRPFLHVDIRGEIRRWRP